MLPAANLESVRGDGMAAAYTAEHLMGRDYALVTTTAAQAQITATYTAP
jgi:hypothetical protein